MTLPSFAGSIISVSPMSRRLLRASRRQGGTPSRHRGQSPCNRKRAAQQGLLLPDALRRGDGIYHRAISHALLGAGANTVPFETAVHWGRRLLLNEPGEGFQLGSSVNLIAALFRRRKPPIRMHNQSTKRKNRSGSTAPVEIRKIARLAAGYNWH